MTGATKLGELVTVGARVGNGEVGLGVGGGVGVRVGRGVGGRVGRGVIGEGVGLGVAPVLHPQGTNRVWKIWKQKLSVKTPSSARVLTSPHVSSLSRAGNARASGNPTTPPSPQMLHGIVGSFVGLEVGCGVSHPHGSAKKALTSAHETGSSRISLAASNSSHVVSSPGSGITPGRVNPLSHKTQKKRLGEAGGFGATGYREGGISGTWEGIKLRLDGDSKGGLVLGWVVS